MEPKERATWMLSVYNSQFSDYMNTAGFVKQEGKWVKVAEPELSEAQKKLMREKKKLLTDVHPAIKLYSGYAETGVIPDDELETMIVSKLNQLMMEITN